MKLYIGSSIDIFVCNTTKISELLGVSNDQAKRIQSRNEFESDTQAFHFVFVMTTPIVGRKKISREEGGMNFS